VKVKTVPSTWMRRDGRRLDCGPYMSGALEAKIRLDELVCEKAPLRSLTSGHDGGIYNGPHFSRTFVDSPEHGVPFLGSAAMLQADLSNLPLLRRRDAFSPNLSYLGIEPGMTLISCSGTIGRMVYARSNMRGMWTSQHIMKVVPDPQRVKPGYVYAFLSSKFGVPLVTSGTYGSIIQSIEPHHIADLPVPRLRDDVEGQVHELIEAAADQRSKAAELRRSVVEKVTRCLGWKHRSTSDLWTVAGSSTLQRRLDAVHHAAGIAAARDCLASHSSTRLGDAVVEVFEPNRGARRKVNDAAYGVPFLSSSEVFRLDPVGDYLISRTRTRHLERQLVGATDLLLPRSGQLGGIIGRAVLPLPTYYGSAASEHLVRVRCRTREDAFFAWAVFASDPGYYAAIGTAYGSSIPSLDCELLSDLRIPWWDGPKRNEVVELVKRMVDALTQAIMAEREGVALVERAVDEPV
jgi:type I restriction enzyme S subunit